MRYFRTLFTILFFLLCYSIPLTHAATEQRTALVIGNGTYSSSPLKNPVNDAADMAASLTKLGFSVTLKKDANHQEMEDAIREFGEKLKKGGTGLFFYAGHGVQIGGRNYLLPVGARINKETDVKFQAVDAEMVLAEMGNAGNNLNIVILDACRDNPFGRSFRSAGRGLAIISDAPRGTFITYSTSPGKVAADGSGRNSPYAESLMRHMNSSGLPIEEVFKEVRKDMGKKTGGQQVPWELSSLEGKFYFRPGSDTQIKAATPSIDYDAEKRKIAEEKERLRQEAEIEEQRQSLEEQKRIRAKQAEKLEERKRREEAAAEAEEQKRLAEEEKRLEKERAALSKQKALEEKRQRIEEEKERIAAEREAKRQAAAERKKRKKAKTYGETTTVAMAKVPKKECVENDGRFCKYADGTVLDTKTNLMWAAKDNGSDINWSNAKSYCENYRGGGYSDWRMPTQDELAGLYDAGKSQHQECYPSNKIHVATDLIHLTCCCPWASETRGSDAAVFYFVLGERLWGNQYGGLRALPVRSGK